MKTWHMRLVDRKGHALSQRRAAGRYLLSWLWFLPALAGAGLAGHTDGGRVSLWLAAGVFANVALACLLPGRQYVHDWLSGTRARGRPPRAWCNRGCGRIGRMKDTRFPCACTAARALGCSRAT
jgi:uncharacterized RDD family membrane protein YckC